MRGPFGCYRLYSDDILCLWAFLAFSNSEFDLLAFCKRLESVTLNCAEVRKYIGARLLLDESEALGFVEPLNGSACCRHGFFLVYLKYQWSGIRTGKAGSVAITYEKQDELLRKRLLRKRETECIGKSALTGNAEYRESSPAVKEITASGGYTYSESRADEIIKSSFEPHYDAAVEQGDIQSWSRLQHHVGRAAADAIA
jgi:hypothetical protein